MSELDTAIAALAEAMRETLMALSFGGSTAELGGKLEAVAEETQNVQVLLDGDVGDVPERYAGWASAPL